MEQREGRINRFKCLAIRQNVADKYGKADGITFKRDIWTEMFEAAKAEKQNDQSELVPFWCFGKNQSVKIERLVPMYPMSKDEVNYERDSQTDKNIVRYFELLGKNEIDKKKYPDLFFCNCNLGYRRDKYSGNMTRKILANDAAEIKSLIDIIEPENIICLGLDTSVVVIRTLIDKKFSCNRVSELIGTGEPYIYGETYIYPVAHPGYWGTSTRGEDNVIADWRRIRK